MSSTVPPPLGPLHHPGRPEVAVEGEVEAEAGDAAGCHPEEVATTMEARPEVAAAAAVAGAVVAVAVGVAAALPLDDEGA